MKLKKFEVRYISQAGRDVQCVVECKEEDQVRDELYHGSNDDPWEIISIDEV